ncbi:MAG: NAD-dependent protein deacetylase [Proteobacteria bacterium]|nr:NAD-dependent protein deacetylase [Pseudomonadota bacterium]
MGQLTDALRHRRVVALTGAGCSTESGIPDYRGPGTRRRARNPVQYREFVSDAMARKRYWARSVVGWPRLSQALPNAAHRALAVMEQSGIVRGLITQNVDRLHHAAGSNHIVELHGALAEVRCLTCGAIEPRDSVQKRLLALNPGWHEQRAELAPDGDAELPTESIERFRVAACQACAGILKPDVVFFGESVPREVVVDAWRLFDEGDALLVIGSSLAVFSGYRFVRRAAERNMFLAIVNIGPTRGDSLAHLRVSGRAGEVLSRLVERCLGPGCRIDFGDRSGNPVVPR